MAAPAARLAPLPQPWPEDAAAILEKMRFGRPEPIGLFRTLAHNPRVLDRIRLGGLLDRGTLSLRQRELAILRSCARCGAEYEWGVHVTIFGPHTGMSPEDIAATVQSDAGHAGWAEDERLIVRLVDALHERAGIDDELWAALRGKFTPAQAIELIVLTGFYHTISFVVNGLRIDREDGAARFPAPPSPSTRP